MESIGWRDRGREERCDVDVGSKPAAAGVIRALRFWLIESSTVALDILRKSAGLSVWMFLPSSAVPKKCADLVMPSLRNRVVA